MMAHRCEGPPKTFFAPVSGTHVWSTCEPVAQTLADRQPMPMDQATQIWGRVHGVFLLGGTVAVIVGFVAGVMYLLQDYRLKRHLPRLSHLQLPSLEFLARVNARVKQSEREYRMDLLAVQDYLVRIQKENLLVRKASYDARSAEVIQ